MTEAIDVIRAIDQLRRDLTGYHGQLVAHDNLQRHCENQRKRIGELEVLYAGVKAENARLRELVCRAARLASEHCDAYGRDDGGCRTDCPWDNVMIDQEGKPVRFTCEIGDLYYCMRELGIEVDG